MKTCQGVQAGFMVTATPYLLPIPRGYVTGPVADDVLRRDMTSRLSRFAVAPEVFRKKGSKVLGLARELVPIHTHLLGLRRLRRPISVRAALLARAFTLFASLLASASLGRFALGGVHGYDYSTARGVFVLGGRHRWGCRECGRLDVRVCGGAIPSSRRVLGTHQIGGAVCRRVWRPERCGSTGPLLVEIHVGVSPECNKKREA